MAKIVALGKLDGGISLTPPAPGVSGYTNLAFGSSGNAIYCGSTDGGSVKATAKAYTAKNAPPPPTCYIPTCSPSGAFLDYATF